MAVDYNYDEMLHHKQKPKFIMDAISQIEQGPRGLSHFKRICNKPDSLGKYVIDHLETCLEF